MIQSMTGYGAATKSSSNYKVTVEFKSLNSKYLEFGLRLPKVYMKYENKLRTMLTKKLGRGKIILLLNVELMNPNKKSLNINHLLVKSYLSELSSLKENLNISGDIDLAFILGLPDIIPTESEEEDEEEWQLIEAAAMEASEQLINSRNEEGNALDIDLAERNKNIGNLLDDIELLAPKRMAYLRERLENSLNDIRNKVSEMDPNRFEQELIFYLEKFDINEEIVRLRQHLTYFEELRLAKKSNGKKLQFLSQEMGREINTIGSKANDAAIQRLVVSMKDELEKIKEQVLNVV